MSDEKERGEKMVTMRMPERVHASIKVLKKKYGTSTLADSLWEFIKQYDPDAAKAGEQVASLRVQIAEILGDEEDEN